MLKTMDDRVWYLSYGSNLSEDRFLTYIVGGQAPGSKVSHVGCVDKTLPTERRHIRLEGWKLVFRHSSSWWGGLVCGIEKDKNSYTHGMLYNITREQFLDVTKQENGIDVHDKLDVDWEALRRDGGLRLFDGVYGFLVSLGNIDGFPVLSFTHPPGTKHARGHRTASEPYLRTIAKGLTPHHVPPDELKEYLRSKEGIDPHWDDKGLEKLIQEVSLSK